MPAKASVEVICGQGPAPAGATIAHYRSLGLDIMPGTGLLAACVPGTFDAWMMLLRDYGTMRLADVLAPAIYYARDGHPLVERANATIATVENLFREHWPTSAAVYLPRRQVPDARHAVHQSGDWPRPIRACSARPRAPAATRAAQIERRAQGVVAGLRRRGDRPLLPHPGDHGHQRASATAACSPARTWRAGRPHVEAPLTYDYGRYTVCKPGPWARAP